MGNIVVKEPVQSAEVQAVIIRANGQRVDLGTIAYWHRNPLVRLFHWFKQFFRGR